MSPQSRMVPVSFGHRTLAEADHWIQSLDPAPVLACKHLVSTPYPQVTISLLTAGEVTAAAGGRLIPFERRDPTPCCADH